MSERVGDLARLVRSKNAGPFWMTMDIMFEDEETYIRVRNSGVINAEAIGRLYRVPAASAVVVNHDLARAIKVSFPRVVSSGAPSDGDIFGGQQYAPLLDVCLS